MLCLLKFLLFKYKVELQNESTYRQIKFVFMFYLFKINLTSIIPKQRKFPNYMQVHTESICQVISPYGWLLWISLTLGNFQKFLAANFLIEVAQIYANFMSSFEVCHFIIKSYFGYFWGQYWKIWVNCGSSIWSHCSGRIIKIEIESFAVKFQVQTISISDIFNY